MYKIIYVGRPIEEFVEALYKAETLRICGFILDDNISSKELELDRKFLQNHNFTEYTFSDLGIIRPDLLFMPYYTKIIKSDIIDKYLFVNLHGGILPKWRGFSSNLWALLNGEKRVGYTFHRVRRGMDSGEIYKVIDVEVDDSDKFIDLRNKIRQIICSQLENILVNIITGVLKPVAQRNVDIAYNCQLKPSDGEVIDWNKPSRYFIGLWQIFSYPPYGTGMKIFIHDEPYYVLKIGVASEIAAYVGRPGAVVNKYDDGSVLIKTQDTGIRVYELMDMNKNKILPGDFMQIGNRLNENILSSGGGRGLDVRYLSQTK